jgi:flagellin
MNSINMNFGAMTAANSLDQNQALLTTSLERLSSGSQIVNPGDNPANLAVSDELTGQNDALQEATTNVQNATSYVQSAASDLGTTGQILTQMSELATEAANPTINASDVADFQQQFSSLQDQLRATIGGTTATIGGTSDVSDPIGTFSGVAIFGPNPGGLPVTIGPGAGQSLTIPEVNLQTGAVGSVITQDSTGAYTLSITDPTVQTQLNAASQQVGTAQGTMGATEARLNFVSSTLSVESENMSSTISNISDVDVAAESTQLAKYNVLVQADTAMLAQANQLPGTVLKLLQGS